MEENSLKIRLKRQVFWFAFLLSAIAILIRLVAQFQKVEAESMKGELIEVEKKSCLQTLSTIERIKVYLVRDHKRKEGDVVTTADLDSYSPSGGFVGGECASGGKLTINPVGKHAEC